MLLGLHDDEWALVNAMLSRTDRMLLGATSTAARARLLTLRARMPSAYSMPPIRILAKLHVSSHKTLQVVFNRKQQQRQLLTTYSSKTEHDREMQAMFAQEWAALEALAHQPHRFIAHAIHVPGHEQPYSFITQYAAGGSTLDRMRLAGGLLAEEVVRFYVAEVALALDHLHMHGFIHHAVVPEHILIGGDGHVVLVGASCIRIRDAFVMLEGDYVGVPEYMAPEILLHAPYNCKVDYWSLGCVIFELLTGISPFASYTINTVVRNIRRSTGRIPSQVQILLNGFGHGTTAPARAAITSLLHGNPEKRLGSLEELRAHPFFDGVEWDTLHQMSAPWTPFRDFDHGAINT